MATFRSKEDGARDQVPLHRFQERIGAFRAMVHMIANRTNSELWILEGLQRSLCKLVSIFFLLQPGESSINFGGRPGGGNRPNDIRCRDLRGGPRDDENSR